MIDHPTNPIPNEPDRNQAQEPAQIALAHDWLVARRGGELVLDAIIQTLHHTNHPITTLYSMFDNGTQITPNIDQLTKSISPLNSFPNWARRWLLFFYPYAIRSLSNQLKTDHQSNPIDLIISTHSAAIKALTPPIHPKSNQPIPHICYCHTPARYLWSQTESYNSPGLKGTLRALGLNIAKPTMQSWDRNSADTVTQFIANSTHTANQIKEHYQRDSIVIHPPVRTHFFTLPDPSNPNYEPRKDHLLLVSALEPYKRVELAIQASKLTDRPLTIVGSGSHEPFLKDYAHQLNAPITFLGQIPDDKLKTQYQSAHAFLFPQIEDFGITAVEAQASGCPIVARRAGGALDTVIEHSTGSFFDDPTPESIANAIDQIPSSTHTQSACRTNALRFSESEFQSKMIKVINDVLRDRASDQA